MSTPLSIISLTTRPWHASSNTPAASRLAASCPSKSSNESTSSSINALFEEQADFLLQRCTRPFETLLDAFNKRYRFNTSGSLGHALIKSAERILNRELAADIKSWAESFIDNTKSNVFKDWYKKQKPRQPEEIVDRAGHRHIRQIVGEVTQSFSSITGALGSHTQQKESKRIGLND